MRNFKLFATMITLIMGAVFFMAFVSKEGHPNVNVVLLGDSNTWLGGDNCDKPKGWNKWFKDKYAPATCKSYARSGATWTNTNVTKANLIENTGSISNDNVIYNQVLRLKEAVNKGVQTIPDIIIVSAGTNDAWFKNKRPGLYSKSVDDVFKDNSFSTGKSVNKVTSLAESVRYNIDIMREAFPNCKFVLLTPMQSTSVPTSEINKVSDIIESCAERMNVKVIRLDKESCVKRELEMRNKKYTYDGTHTSELGAKNNGFLVADRISKMFF